MPDVLIKAFATTANMLPQCRLVVVGSGPLERSLRVMADLSGIANKVLWLGDGHGKCLLPAFDLLALPSRYEGLPHVTLEALSAGLPVVATATAGVELPIRHRRNGLIVPPDRPDLFATALGGLLSDPLKLEQFGRRSREISTESTVRRMVYSTHDAYLNCIGMRGHGGSPPPMRGRPITPTYRLITGVCIYVAFLSSERARRPQHLEWSSFRGPPQGTSQEFPDEMRRPPSTSLPSPAHRQRQEGAAGHVHCPGGKCSTDRFPPGLRVILTGSNNWYDHTDWAGARLLHDSNSDSDFALSHFRDKLSVGVE